MQRFLERSAGSPVSTNPGFQNPVRPAEHRLGIAAAASITWVVSPPGSSGSSAKIEVNAKASRKGIWRCPGMIPSGDPVSDHRARLPRNTVPSPPER